MTAVSREARLHEKVVQQIARDSLPRVQATHTTRMEDRVAQKVNITLVDDLDGSEASETLTFGLDGNSYEIDLSEQNAKELRTRLEDFVAAARKVSGRRKSPKKHAHAPSEVRKWAKEQGMEVSARGVIPVEVVKAFEAAH